MREMRNACRFLADKPEEKRVIRSWDDNVKMSRENTMQGCVLDSAGSE
jgi:hypothetical protein